MEQGCEGYPWYCGGRQEDLLGSRNFETRDHVRRSILSSSAASDLATGTARQTVMLVPLWSMVSGLQTTKRSTSARTVLLVI